MNCGLDSVRGEMARFSQYFALELTQGALDFVDVDVIGDSPVYIDPHCIRTQRGPWVEACQISIATYFESLVEAIRSQEDGRVAQLIRPLTEPNETHLGQSSGRSRGHSLGSAKKAQELIDALSASHAMKTGLVSDLEESVLFIDDIGVDILSDIATCLIRNHLVAYTAQQCALHGVPTELQYVDPVWDVDSRTWREVEAQKLPRGPDGPIILVPRAIVRARTTVDAGKFFRGYIRPFYEEEELSKGFASEFVRLVAEGTTRQRLKVRLTALGESLGSTKEDLVRHVETYPQALVNYREYLEAPKAPLSPEKLAEYTGGEGVDLQELFDAIKAIAPGTAGATSYHRAVAAFLTGLFGENVGNEQVETPIHGGRKRIDITYDNIAVDGFFRWLSLNWPTSTLSVECKNYQSDPANPEVDQIAMRLSRNRGLFGILVARTIADREKMDARCRSVADDDHGFVVALDDDDLEQLAKDAIAAVPGSKEAREFPLLRRRFAALTGQY